jgi:hypothetical protein
MRLIYRFACLVGWHNWWGAGERVCLECGRLAERDQPVRNAGHHCDEQQLQCQRARLMP